MNKYIKHRYNNKIQEEKHDQVVKDTAWPYRHKQKRNKAEDGQDVE
jgi:hypothetical protein